MKPADRKPRRRGPLRRTWRTLRKARAGDFAFWAGALSLAALSAYLPWDVYINHARYGPPEFQFSRSGEVPADVVALQEGRAPLFDMVAETYVGDPPPRPLDDPDGVDPFTTAAIPLDTGEEEAEPREVPPGVDPITTASVPSSGGAAAHSYTLLDAGRGLALIADQDGIYIVRPGTLLPDGRRVSAIVGRGPHAQIVPDDDTEVRLD